MLRTVFRDLLAKDVHVIGSPRSLLYRVLARLLHYLYMVQACECDVLVNKAFHGCKQVEIEKPSASPRIQE